MNRRRKQSHHKRKQFLVHAFMNFLDTAAQRKTGICEEEEAYPFVSHWKPKMIARLSQTPGMYACMYVLVFKSQSDGG